MVLLNGTIPPPGFELIHIIFAALAGAAGGIVLCTLGCLADKGILQKALKAANRLRKKIMGRHGNGH
jgi:hypothetical protein